MSDSITLPGDKIAAIEEYEAGSNTYDDGDMVRSSVIGRTDIDKSNRLANINNEKTIAVPKSGDIIIGTVAAVMSSMIAVTINYINGKPNRSNLECICGTRNIRRKNIALVNDIVTLRIKSHINGTLHAVMDEPELGVLFTKCRKCGGKVVQIRDAVKCTECSWIDERKISSNFGNSDFVKISD